MVSGEDLIAAFDRAMRPTPLAFYARAVRRQDGSGYWYHIHPSEEPVFIDLARTFANVDAKTSSVGPGYHAFLIDLLAAVAADCGVTWRWDDDELADDTGYRTKRNFSDLQDEMARFLGHLAGIVAERRGTGSHQMMAMDVGFGVDAFAEDIVTPMGPLPLSELEAAAQSPDAALALARRYYSWWHEGFGPNFYRGLALQGLWQDMSWTSPADDAERAAMQRVIGWSDLAASPEADWPALPADAVSELRALVASRAPRTLPATDGVGYRRHLMRRRLPGAWEINLPGSLLATIEQDGEQEVFWNDDLTVRGSSLTATIKNAAPIGDNEPVERKVEVESSSDGDGLILSATASTRSDAATIEECIVTVWMRGAEFIPLAERIAASINYVRPRKPRAEA